MPRYDHIVMQVRLHGYANFQASGGNENERRISVQADTRTHAAPCIDSAARSYVGAARNLGTPPPPKPALPSSLSLSLVPRPLGSGRWVARVLACLADESPSDLCTGLSLCRLVGARDPNPANLMGHPSPLGLHNYAAAAPISTSTTSSNTHTPILCQLSVHNAGAAVGGWTPLDRPALRRVAAPADRTIPQSESVTASVGQQLSCSLARSLSVSQSVSLGWDVARRAGETDAADGPNHPLQSARR